MRPCKVFTVCPLQELPCSLLSLQDPAVQESPAPSLAWCQGTGRSQPTFFLLSIWFYLNHESAPGNQSSERKSTPIKGREPPTASAMWRAASFLTQAPSARGGCPRLHSLLRKQDPRCKVTHPRSQVEKNLSQAAGPQSHTCDSCAAQPVSPHCEGTGAQTIALGSLMAAGLGLSCDSKGLVLILDSGAFDFDLGLIRLGHLSGPLTDPPPPSGSTAPESRGA